MLKYLYGDNEFFSEIAKTKFSTIGRHFQFHLVSENVKTLISSFTKCPF